MCIFIYIHVYVFVHTTMLKYTLLEVHELRDSLATGIQAPAGPCKLMNIAI